MTLIVTNISKHGIVQVADSAETIDVPGGPTYVRTGARKIVPVHTIGAGISMWGKATVSNLPTDLWIERYVNDEVSSDWTFRHLADNLAKRLNQTGEFPGSAGTAVGGLHITGYETRANQRVPVLYHVHNKHPQEIPHELRVYCDFPDSVSKGNDLQYVQQLAAGHVDWHIRNGAFEPFALLWDAIVRKPDCVLAQLRGQNFQCPYPDALENRARFYALLVEIVARLLSMSNSLEVISLPVSVLTIDSSGIHSYQPSLHRASTTTPVHLPPP